MGISVRTLVRVRFTNRLRPRFPVAIIISVTVTPRVEIRFRVRVRLLVSVIVGLGLKQGFALGFGSLLVVGFSLGLHLGSFQEVRIGKILRITVRSGVEFVFELVLILVSGWSNVYG